MEYSERIKTIEELLEQMVELGVLILIATPKGVCLNRAFLAHDDCGDFRDAIPERTESEEFVVRRVSVPGSLDLVLVLSQTEDRVYRKTWGLDDGDKEEVADA